MLKTIDYSKLQTGDLVHTTSISTIAVLIRIREAGVKNTFNTKISTHTGIVVKINEEVEMFGIAEMVAGQGLRIASFNDYLKGGTFDKGIISISRYNKIAPSQISGIGKNVLSLWKEGKKYDTSGCLKWVFPFLKDKKQDFYCSELCEYLAIQQGFSYCNEILDTDNVMPYTLQKSLYTKTIQ